MFCVALCNLALHFCPFTLFDTVGVSFRTNFHSVLYFEIQHLQHFKILFSKFIYAHTYVCIYCKHVYDSHNKMLLFNPFGANVRKKMSSLRKSPFNAGNERFIFYINNNNTYSDAQLSWCLAYKIVIVFPKLNETVYDLNNDWGLGANKYFQCSCICSNNGWEN